MKERQLLEMAQNLWWSWQPWLWRLCERIEPEAWEQVEGHFDHFVQKLGAERILAIARKRGLVPYLQQVHNDFARYMERPAAPGGLERFEKRPIAYFCAEFGLHHAIAQYSGGLGVLAGDYLKAASDYGLPMVGVCLFYRQGYFTQDFDGSGRQVERYPELDPVQCGFRPAVVNGEELVVSIETGEGELRSKVFEAAVGKSRLVMLDTEWDEFRPTREKPEYKRLYSGGGTIRLLQEMVLGIGGLRALEALGISPSVIHLNEGHSAFVLLEAARRLMERDGIGFEQAARRVASMSVFTTHTPVEAGHDRFPPELVTKMLEPMRERLGIDESSLLGLGRVEPENEKETFCMTVLAMKLCRKRNGVSALHGQVTREMWHGLWPSLPAEHVPVGHVTNGVHTETWMAAEVRDLLHLHLGSGWMHEPEETGNWEGVESMGNEEVWAVRNLLKIKLLEHLKKRYGVDDGGYLEVPERLLVLGFARRFALYKRATLLLQDTGWLSRLLGDSERPVMILMAGKAHPRDQQAKDALAMLLNVAQRREFAGRLIVLPDYDMRLARLMVQGVDVWLNTPRKPMEASGTSGQKAAMNGVLNCSIPDGWWAEAWDGRNGFVIGDGSEHSNPDEQDRRDGLALRKVIDGQVLPLFFERDAEGTPDGWVETIKHAWKTICPRFCARRMVRDYLHGYYLPAAKLDQLDAR
ncbi:MAG: alpha-glucan family phosphorylase [Deltaproteobacteria bacterium]|nr:MAG: alpha-glucan family phosphorylase [Deltaproteobacteria bacterium]